MNTKNKLFIISGPSGAGKTTLTRKVLETDKNICLSVSATTRKPRIGEFNNKHYIFLLEEEFLEKVKNNEFLEYAKVHGSYYGTLKSTVTLLFENKKDVVLEIDVQGAIQVKKHYKDAVLIFITISALELENRLKARATESEKIINKRLKNSIDEIQKIDLYDYIIENDELTIAFNKLLKIINNERS